MSDAPAAAAPAPCKICTLTKIEMVGSWTVNIDTTDCGICKSNIKEACLDCISIDADVSNCTVSEGNCGHHFHTHCIQRWVNTASGGQNHQNCPSCQVTWDTANIHTIAA